MLPPFAASGPVMRNLSLALAVLGSIFLLLRTLDIGPFGRRDAPELLEPVVRPPARVIKATERIDPVNELYLASLRSHEEHDRLNGYNTTVFRERISHEYSSVPAYLLTILDAELEKPVEEQKEWVVWFGGDVVLLNPQIPLEAFLPPAGFENISVLATQDDEGFNAGVFFIRVGNWSVNMLEDVLECPTNRTEVKEARYKHAKAIELSLRSPVFRQRVLYHPRKWYNAYARDAPPRGSLLTHFNSPGGDKWSKMDETLRQLSDSPKAFSVPFSDTDYTREIDAYWGLLREAYDLLAQAQLRFREKAVKAARSRLEYAVTYEMDKERVMQRALVMMKVALGIDHDGDFL